MANDRRPFDPLRRPRRRRRVRSDRQRRPPRAPRLGLDSARAAAAQARAARAQPAAGARPPVVRLAGRLSEYHALLGRRLESPDPDVAWAMRENLKKKRLAGVF